VNPTPRKARPAALSAIAAALILSAWSQAANAQATGQPAPLPQQLSATGLYVEGSSTRVDPKNLAFAPQYPLWSDGTRKRRWIYLPPGAAIDASRPDAWEFPPGTRLWKEFSLDRPVETRFIERLPDGAWRFATYIWDADGTDATLAPADGVAALPVQGAPHGSYAIPGEADCRACHEGAAVPVLGFSALQLSSDRDPLAPHADSRSDIDLPGLASRGLIKNLPPALISKPPRIEVNSPAERAALGYLHGNCAHCHNDNGAPAPVDLTLAQSVTSGAAGAKRVLRSMIDARSRFRGHGLGADAPLIAPGSPDASVLIARVSSRNPQTQMPPLGTQLRDAEALALLERWIAEKSHTPEELSHESTNPDAKLASACLAGPRQCGARNSSGLRR
jgi:mono/diheme cytochrome c family protein